MTVQTKHREDPHCPPFQTHLPYPAQYGIGAQMLSDAPTHQGTAAALDARPPASLKVQHIAVGSTPAPMAVEGLGGLQRRTRFAVSPVMIADPAMQRRVHETPKIPTACFRAPAHASSD